MKNKIERTDKNRFLSIIYFLDGGKTRSLKISYVWLKCIALVSTCLVLWAIFASFFFIRNLFEMNRLSERLQSSLETIFQYQVKENSLYETVYLNKKNEPQKMKVSEPLVVSEKAPPQNPIKTTNLLESKQLQILSEKKDWLIELESPSLSKDEHELKLSIALRNKKAHQRAEGLIWARAEWLDETGKKHLVTAPQSIPEKELSGQPNANTFSIRQFKIKSFSFSIPDKSKVLSKLEIWIADRSKNQSKFEIIEAPLSSN